MACHILKPCLSISYISSPWCSFISPMFSNLSSLVALRVRSGTACLLSCHRKKAELGLGTPSKPREVTTSSIKTSCLLEISGCYMFFYIDFTFFAWFYMIVSWKETVFTGTDWISPANVWIYLAEGVEEIWMMEMYLSKKNELLFFPKIEYELGMMFYSTGSGVELLSYCTMNDVISGEMAGLSNR